MSVQFTNDDHQARFAEVWRQMDEYQRSQSQEWIPALYLLTSTANIWNKVKACVDLRQHLIWWDKILHRRMGHYPEEIFLIRLARECYTNEGKPGWSALWHELGENEFFVVLQAVALRRYGVQEFTPEQLARFSVEEVATNA